MPVTLYLVAIAWMYVVLMMALAEALSPQGTLLGALVTFVFYGCAPLALVLYLLGTPARRRARRAAQEVPAAPPPDDAGAAADPPVSASATRQPPSAP